MAWDTASADLLLRKLGLGEALTLRCMRFIEDESAM